MSVRNHLWQPAKVNSKYHDWAATTGDYRPRQDRSLLHLLVNLQGRSGQRNCNKQRVTEGATTS
eukprot:1994752-Heterocapsa_arctica.AAC.1